MHSSERRVVADSLMVTILLDGNKPGTVYFYEGKPSDPSAIREAPLVPDGGFFKYVSKKNYPTYSDMLKFQEEKKRARMTEEYVRAEEQKIIDRHMATAPYFTVKWSRNEKQDGITNVINILVSCYVQKYEVEQATKDDLIFLSKKTGIRYPEMN